MPSKRLRRPKGDFCGEGPFGLVGGCSGEAHKSIRVMLGEVEEIVAHPGPCLAPGLLRRRVGAGYLAADEALCIIPPQLVQVSKE